MLHFCGDHRPLVFNVTFYNMSSETNLRFVEKHTELGIGSFVEFKISVFVTLVSYDVLI